MARIAAVLLTAALLVVALVLELPERLGDAIDHVVASLSAKPSDTVDDTPPPRLWVEPSALVDVAELVHGNNEFGLDLYQRLKNRNKNIVVAPLSVATMLAMARAGADGDTAAQFDRVLHTTFDETRLHDAFSALIQGLRDDQATPGVKISGNSSQADQLREPRFFSTNGIWTRQPLDIQKSFHDILDQHYGCDIRTINATATSGEAAQEIDAWIRKATGAKIRGVTSPRDLDMQASLLLLSAIYFRGSWATPFVLQQTTDQDFQVTAERRVTVPMMHKVADPADACRSWSDGSVDVLEMFCYGGKFSMTFLLPKRYDGLADLEATLTLERLDALLSKLTPSSPEIFLPRFRIVMNWDFTSELAELGLDDAFLPGANFARVSGPAVPLRLASVVQSTFINVNEAGIEAAVATAATLSKSAEVLEHFRADHPFLFLLRDVRSGSLLLLGRYTQPD